MKYLITTIAALVLVGCGESQQSVPAPEAKPVELVAEASTPEPPTAEAPDIDIHEAAKKGDIEAIKQHIAAGTHVNAKGREGFTPLHFAADRGHAEIAELLITKGADVNGKTDFNSTPLQEASIKGHKEVAELLISSGANVNAKNKVGNTPLHIAAYMKFDLAELLIAKGATINVTDDVSRTPLDDAIEGNKKETVELLRKHGGKTGEELKAAGN